MPTLTSIEEVRDVNAGTRVFDNSMIEGVDLSDWSFEGASFQGSVFSRCNLSGVSFLNAKLKYTQFRNCEMDGINLQGIDFKNIDLDQQVCRWCA